MVGNFSEVRRLETDQIDYVAVIVHGISARVTLYHT